MCVCAETSAQDLIAKNNNEKIEAPHRNRGCRMRITTAVRLLYRAQSFSMERAEAT